MAFITGGMGGGTSNAICLVKYFTKNKINKNLLSILSKRIGSDVRLFLHKQGFLKNLGSLIDIKIKQKFYFVLIQPRVKCSTKEIYSNVRNFSKKENFNKLMRGVSTLGLPDIAVKGDGKEISIVAVDKKTPSNDYSIVVGESDKKFTAYFKTENFKMIQDDYDVAISKQKISHFINKSKPIQYWVAIEPDSEF